MKKNYIYIITAASLWGTTGIFINWLKQLGFTSNQICADRVVVTTIVLAAIILIKDVSLFKIKLRDIWVFIGTGLLSITFFTYCYYASISVNGMAIAAVLLYTAPVFVAVMSAAIFKSGFSKHKILALAMSVAGCALVSGVLTPGSGSITLFGVLVGLCSGFGYALYSIFGKFAINKKYSSLTISFYTFLLASAVSVPVAISNGVSLPAASFSSVALLIIFGIATGVLPYLLYIKGLESTEPSMASISATVEPVVAAALGIVILKEHITFVMLAGMLLILTSLILIARKK